MFPENIETRSQYIFDQVLAGNFEAKWSDLVYTTLGKEVRLQVMDDALKVDGVRVNVSATLEQRLADVFDASLLTSYVADQMFRCAVRRATPCPMSISTTVASMVKHSQSVDKQLLPDSFGLVATCGKHWVLDKQLETKSHSACNYGWHFVGPSFQGIVGFEPVTGKGLFSAGVRVIQPNATAHDPHHADYSQICQLVSQQCWIDGVEMRFSDVVKDPVLGYLVSHQGPLSIDRQPGVDPVVGQVVLFPTNVSSSVATDGVA